MVRLLNILFYQTILINQEIKKDKIKNVNNL